MTNRLQLFVMFLYAIIAGASGAFFIFFILPWFGVLSEFAWCMGSICLGVCGGIFGLMVGSKLANKAQIRAVDVVLTIGVGSMCGMGCYLLMSRCLINYLIE
jgi:hypothetical protein